ncbi:MAG: DUF3179 domain-containing (seleno)protein [Candidatus Roizmanbacteria bacterium]
MKSQLQKHSFILIFIVLAIAIGFGIGSKKKDKDGASHKNLVKREDIVEAGQKKDGIPSINKPMLITNKDASVWLKDDELGVSIEGSDSARFYPLQILKWHEIVNDTYEGNPIMATYSPLSASSAIYKRMVNGQKVEFGVLGRVWNSQSVWYDRLSDSWWSPILGRSIYGSRSGDYLTKVPHEVASFALWKALYPKGLVLSRNTGHIRKYDKDQYKEYEDSSKTVAPYKPKDVRLAAKNVVIGITVTGHQKAYETSMIEEKKEIDDVIGSQKIHIEYFKPLKSIRVYKISSNKKKERAAFYQGYWFTWAATYPKTELYMR